MAVDPSPHWLLSVVVKQATRPRDIPAHTGLRGLAAVIVMVAHLKLDRLYPEPFVQWATRFVYWHGQAVDLFFMLSGFVLCHVYAFRDRISWRDYAAARFARVYPLALVMMIALLVLDGYSYFRHDINSELLSVDRILINTLLLNGLSDTWVRQAINPPSWSVSVEAFLYLAIFPTLTWLFARRLRSGVWIAVTLGLALLLLMVVGPVAREVLLVREISWPCRGIFGFTAGYAMRHLWEKHPFPGLSAVAWQSRFAVLAVSAILITLAAEWELFLLLPSFALIVYVTYENTNPLSKVFSNRALIYLGERSYSIYLIHFTVIEFTYRLILYPSQLADGSFPLLSRMRATLGVFALTFLLSEISYRFFEQPLRDWLRRWLSADRRGKKKAV